MKLALWTYALYTALMALGMAVMHFVFHDFYTAPSMSEIIIFFELAMSLLVGTVRQNYFRHDLTKLATRPISKWILIAFALLVGNLVAMAVQIVVHGHFAGRSAFLVATILATTLVVGFSEETLFRGILLPTLARRYRRPLAIVLASALFSAFHTVNLLGGLPFSLLSFQWLNTFVMGTMFCGFALEFGCLWPLMLYHAGYDFLLIAGQYYRAPLAPNTLFAMGFSLLLALIFLGRSAWPRPKVQ